MSDHAGQTRASAAIGAGNPAIAASFRFHRPRGPLCGRGWCGQCDGACGAAAGTAAHRDRLRPLGRLAERYPPWFYERRMLRPRALRGPALSLLRHLSAAPPLSDRGVRGPPRAYREIEAATVLVGRGPAPSGALHVNAADGRVALGYYGERTLGVLDHDALVAVRFERLVLATGSYDRLPPVPGNDLPGVIGAHAAAIYGAAGAITGKRVAIWAPDADLAPITAMAERHGARIAHASPVAPRRITGSRRVAGVEADRLVACDLVIVGVRQPAIELALQAGAQPRLTRGELAVLIVGEAPAWLELIGAAAVTTSGVAHTATHDDAFACPCEDVRFGDLRACVAQGFDQVELVKRRTGAMTGPCQGKLCAGAVLGSLRDLGLDPVPMTPRPLAWLATLGELAADA
jgi:hypothetical protein